MKPARRKQSDDSATRNALIDATEALLLEEGYAAVSSRKIGERAGVKPPLIHYYFATIDDLYLAVFRRSVENSLADHQSVLDSGRPLSALWEFNDHPRSRLGNELTALANNRPAIREELVAHGDRIRKIEVTALKRHFARKGLKPEIAPEVAAMLLSSVTHQMRVERTLGISNGHRKTSAYFKKWLKMFDATGAAAPGLETESSAHSEPD
jgi:TetR/AcrR family transcriptional regulator